MANYHPNPPAATYRTQSFATGIAPPGMVPMERAVSKKEKVEIWFIEPLLRFNGDDGFVCLLVCFPLIETIARYELQIDDSHDVKFSHGSPALSWFAKFMSVPVDRAQEIWDALRNGLMHRGMIKASISYILTGESSARVAELNGDVLRVHVWILRERVVDLLRKHHRQLWQDTSSPLPKITVIQ